MVLRRSSWALIRDVHGRRDGSDSKVKSEQLLSVCPGRVDCLRYCKLRSYVKLPGNYHYLGQPDSSESPFM